MSFLVKAFLTLFVVIDPIGLTPIFITLAGNRSSAEQARIALVMILAITATVQLNCLRTPVSL